MLSHQMKTEAAERGAEWGKQEAELAAERGQWPEWRMGLWAGWLPHDEVPYRERRDEQWSDRDEYEMTLESAAKAAYEAARAGGAA